MTGSAGPRSALLVALAALALAACGKDDGRPDAGFDLVGLWEVDMATMPWPETGPPPPPGYARRLTVGIDGTFKMEVVQDGRIQVSSSGPYRREGKDGVVLRVTHIDGRPHDRPYDQRGRVVDGTLRFPRTDPRRTTDEIVFHRLR